VYPAGDPVAVYPELHVAVTVHVDPTAIMLGPHVPCPTLAEFATVTPGPAVHVQNPAAPVHVPAT
jgi:hypothetical protein